MRGRDRIIIELMDILNHFKLKQLDFFVSNPGSPDEYK